MDFAKKDKRPSKCYFTQSQIAPHSASAKPQLLKKVCKLAETSPYIHTVDLILPEELHSLVAQRLAENGDSLLQYSRVFMSLQDILSGEFFNYYFKQGDVLMRSQGRSRIDNLYYIHSGILHLELDRATYERCGLVGEPIPDGGRKHLKQRFLVKCNLRLPSMLHGKKGFERIVWAAKHVLVGDVQWLFVDLASGKGKNKQTPILTQHPAEVTVKPQLSKLSGVAVPWLPNEHGVVEFTYAAEILEWLGLLLLESPRVQMGDKMDSFLCRYQLPRPDLESKMIGENTVHSSDIVHLQWHGFAPPSFVERVLTLVQTASADRKTWFGFNIGGFERQAHTLLVNNTTDWLCWQCED